MNNPSDSPLNVCNKNSFKHFKIINKSHAFIHCVAFAFLIYYRTSNFLFQDFNNHKFTFTFNISWFLVFLSEMCLFFAWFLALAHRWNPISRSAFPERLPEDTKLPGLDVFICTADPNKEPTFDVMNTVISAMALDYPPENLHVYLSDDGFAAITLHGMKQTLKFAKWWIPFCRKYGVKTTCPKAYFSSSNEDEDHVHDLTHDFLADKENIKEKYEKWKEGIVKCTENDLLGRVGSGNIRDHSAFVQVVNETDEVGMPLLVYVSREKRPSYHHHFKAGALNVLLRVSGIISNAPYILVLDCDMYSNDPTSARQAMCFHLDPKISSSLAFVQFPQLFHNVSKNDIYDSQIRYVFKICWYGMDGLGGSLMCGTNFYVKREALYDGTSKNVQTSNNLEALLVPPTSSSSL